MFSYFLSSTPPTRFDETADIKQIFPLLKALRSKEAELKAAAQKYGAGTTDYRKHTVIAGILSLLDQRIAEFNNNKAKEDLEEETKDVIKLVQDMAKIVRDKLIAFEFTLMLPRNSNREMAKTATTVGTYAAAGAAVVAMPLGVIGSIFTLFIAAPTVSQRVSDSLGLNSPAEMTASVALLRDFSETLTRIGENLGLAKNWNKATPSTVNNQIPDEFLCPLGGNIMKRPVFCLLDNPPVTCDEEIIRKWLEKDKRSPFTRNPLNGQSIDSVLRKNVAVENMIAKAREDNPALFDQEAQQNKVSLVVK